MTLPRSFVVHSRFDASKRRPYAANVKNTQCIYLVVEKSVAMEWARAATTMSTRDTKKAETK